MVAEFTDWVPPEDEAEDYYIGFDQKGGSYFDGEIEGIKLTEEFKDDSQIKEVYDETKDDY